MKVNWFSSDQLPEDSLKTNDTLLFLDFRVFSTPERPSQERLLELVTYSKTAIYIIVQYSEQSIDVQTSL